MRSTAFTATVRIEQNEAGTVVFEEELPLEPDESQKLTVDYPAVGNYTITVTVVGSNTTATTATPTTGSGEGRTVSTYTYEIGVVPPDYEIIVLLLEDDGGIDIYKVSA